MTAIKSTVMRHATIDQWVLRIAGVFILLSLLCAHFFDPRCLWFTVFVGVNLFQSSFTGFCPLANLLKFMGVQSGVAFCPAKGPQP